MKKIISLVLAVVILSLCFSVIASIDKNDKAHEKNYVLCSKNDSILIENNNLSLSFDYEKSAISLRNSKSGSSYMSVPSGNVTGIKRASSLSMLVLTVLDENGKIKTINSFSECVKEQNFKVYTAENYLKIVYEFLEYGITIPVEFGLLEQSLTASIVVKDIIDKNSKLLDIALMPYFAAADSETDGYMLLPDGSGAIINFNNGKSKAGDSEYSVYGTDALQKKDYKEVDVNCVNLPMYALYFERELPESLTSYITKGAAMAKLTAFVSDGNNPYNNAYFTFNYRPYTLTTLLDRSSKAQKLYLASDKVVDCDDYTVEYTFEAGESANIATTAEYVSNILFAGRKAKKTKEYRVFLDVYMSVYKQVYTMGVPHYTNKALTTLDDLIDVSKDFKNPIMLLKGLDSYGAVSNEISSSFKISSKVGNVKEYKSLSKKATLYPQCELIRFDKSNFTINNIFHSARSVTGKNLKEYYYNPATLLSEGTSYDLLTVPKIYRVAKKYATSLQKKGINTVAPLTLGNSPYTDNLRSDRENTVNTFKNSMDNFSKQNISILLENPDGYALPFADSIISLPTQSSSQSLIDYSVPFIQMIVGKYVDYSGQPINLTGDTNDAVLECAATGSSLCFSIIGSDYNEIRDTDLDYLYSAEYSLLRKNAISLQKGYSKNMNVVANAHIVGYEIMGEISCTSFSNGYKVIVNRTDQKLEAFGETVKAKSYIVIKNGGNAE